jgi:hypothetical protein
MNFTSKPLIKDPKKGLIVFGKPIGMFKHLFDRYRNYLAWFQLPLLVYTALISTLNYFPDMFKGHIVEVIVVGFLGFITFTVVAMYLDLKFIFPSERNFMYKGTPYFDEKFGELHDEITKIKEL